MMRNLRVLLVWGILSAGCSGGDIRPVDLYPEDTCALCRMAISDARFASEIIESDGTVHKFDDVGCLLQFREQLSPARVAAIFLKDYETVAWMRYEHSTIVETGIATPMASGKVAFAESGRAREFARAHPAADTSTGCCENGEHTH